MPSLTCPHSRVPAPAGCQLHVPNRSAATPCQQPALRKHVAHLAVPDPLLPALPLQDAAHTKTEVKEEAEVKEEQEEEEAVKQEQQQPKVGPALPGWCAASEHGHLAMVWMGQPGVRAQACGCPGCSGWIPQQVMSRTPCCPAGVHVQAAACQQVACACPCCRRSQGWPRLSRRRRSLPQRSLQQWMRSSRRRQQRLHRPRLRQQQRRLQVRGLATCMLGSPCTVPGVQASLDPSIDPQQSIEKARRTA